MDSNQTLKLTGMLDQKKTKKQMRSDIRQLERIVAALRVTGVFAEAETKRDEILDQAKTSAQTEN